MGCRLNRCLQQLMRADNAGPFLEPVPWVDWQLHDYLEIVEDPMDLRTISERLSDSGYKDRDGLIDPELFWADTELCWLNALKYYGEDMELEVCRMAVAMSNLAESLENDFWCEL